jgi:hypothetical protein
VNGGTITGWISAGGPAVLLLQGGPGLSEYLAPSLPSWHRRSRLCATSSGLPPSVTDGDRTVEGTWPT